jgi:hypothetical protein
VNRRGLTAPQDAGQMEGRVSRLRDILLATRLTALLELSESRAAPRT